MRGLLAACFLCLATSLGLANYQQSIHHELRPKTYQQKFGTVMIAVQNTKGEMRLNPSHLPEPGWTPLFQDRDFRVAEKRLGVRFHRLEYKKARSVERYLLEYPDANGVVRCVYDANGDQVLLKQSARLTLTAKVAAIKKAGRLFAFVLIPGLLFVAVLSFRPKPARGSWT